MSNEKPTPLSAEEILKAKIDKVCELVSQGHEVQVDRETALAMGAFEEDAISAEDAEDARFDHLLEFDEEEE